MKIAYISHHNMLKKRVGEWVSEWVSEWVTDGNLVILQLYHDENKLIVNVMMIISALY
jgi:putative intracellular protease/amidase